MKFIHQINNQDCGFTCLKMLLAHYHHDKRYLFLQEKNICSLSYFALIELGKKYGLVLGGYSFQRKEDILKLQKQWILVSIKQQKTTHAVLIYIKQKTILMLDPSFGSIKISHNDFFSLWNQCALVVEQTLTFNFSPPTFHPVLKRYTFFLSTIKIISFSCLIVGLGFINYQVSLLIPILLLASFLAFEIIYKSSCLLLLSKFDTDLIRRCHTLPFYSLEEYKTYETFKSKYVSLPIDFLFRLASVLFISTLIVINSIYNLIFLGLIIPIVLFDFLCMQKRLVKAKYKIGLLEQSLVDEKERAISIFQALHHLTYRLVARDNIKRSLYFSIVFIGIICSMIAQQIVSLSFLLFYSALSFYLIDNGLKLLNLSQEINEYYLLKNKYLYLLVATDNWPKQ